MRRANSPRKHLAPAKWRPVCIALCMSGVSCWPDPHCRTVWSPWTETWSWYIRDAWPAPAWTDHTLNSRLRPWWDRLKGASRVATTCSSRTNSGISRTRSSDPRYSPGLRICERGRQGVLCRRLSRAVKWASPCRFWTCEAARIRKSRVCPWACWARTWVSQKRARYSGRRRVDLRRIRPNCRCRLSYRETMWCLARNLRPKPKYREKKNGDLACAWRRNFFEFFEWKHKTTQKLVKKIDCGFDKTFT